MAAQLELWFPALPAPSVVNDYFSSIARNWKGWPLYPGQGCAEGPDIAFLWSFPIWQQDADDADEAPEDGKAQEGRCLGSSVTCGEEPPDNQDCPYCLLRD